MIARGQLLGLAIALLLCSSARAKERALVVYTAVSRELLILDGEARAVRRRLACFGLPRWALRVGVLDDRLLLLDAERPAALLIPLAELRTAARGGSCPAGQARARRLALATGDQPYAGLLLGDRIYLSFFSKNRVELYRYRPALAGGAPSLRLERTLAFPESENLGLSDLAFQGGSLAVAATGYRCFARRCPRGRLGEGRLFFLPADGLGHAPFPSLRPSNRNPAGLYTHAATGTTYLISAGAFEGGHGSVERILAPRRLGPALRLPRNAAAARAFPLGVQSFAVLSFAGDRLYLVDALRDRLRVALRFDGRELAPVPASAPVPDRQRADLQDLLPLSEDAYLLLDSLGEQLVRFRYRERDASVKVLGLTALGQAPPAAGRARVSPSWALWLSLDR